MLTSCIWLYGLLSVLTTVCESIVFMFVCPTAHLQKLMSDKKCAAEKKAEMEEVITQVGVSWDKVWKSCFCFWF